MHLRRVFTNCFFYNLYPEWETFSSGVNSLRRKSLRNSQFKFIKHGTRGAFGHILKQRTDLDNSVFVGTFHYTIRFHLCICTCPCKFHCQKDQNVLTCKSKLKSFLPESNCANTVVSGLSDCYTRLGVVHFGIAQVQNSAKTNKPGKE